MWGKFNCTNMSHKSSLPIRQFNHICEIVVKEVNKCFEQTMWSVAPVCITQVSTPKAFLFITLAEKTECGEQETILATALDAKEIALTMGGSWTVEAWWTPIKDRSCWY